MRRRDGLPVWIPDAQQPAIVLRRADLVAKSALGHYDEAWLQTLLHCHPEIFPIEQIEPGFGDLIPLCCELPLLFGGGRTGALDNLLATRDGGLVLVETKLWRNPEARRSAVAQALEYAAAVFGMSYGELESAVLRARQAGKMPASSLFEIVAGDSEGIDEPEFIDAVSRNLQRGRAIIAVLGDGIREDIIPLANLVQSHAGYRFTFALVELAVYETPATGVRLVVPSVLAQTMLIERGVVRIEGDVPAGQRVIVEPVSLPSKASSGRRMGIGEDEFFELLGQRDPGLPEVLKSFLVKAEADLQRILGQANRRICDRVEKRCRIRPPNCGGQDAAAIRSAASARAGLARRHGAVHSREFGGRTGGITALRNLGSSPLRERQRRGRSQPAFALVLVDELDAPLGNIGNPAVTPPPSPSCVSLLPFAVAAHCPHGGSVLLVN
jgi:hypothetical protein